MDHLKEVDTGPLTQLTAGLPLRLILFGDDIGWVHQLPHLQQGSIIVQAGGIIVLQLLHRGRFVLSGLKTGLVIHACDFIKRQFMVILVTTHINILLIRLQRHALRGADVFYPIHPCCGDLVSFFLKSCLLL